MGKDFDETNDIRQDTRSDVSGNAGSDFGGDLSSDNGVNLNGYHQTEVGNRIYSDGSVAPNWGFEGETGHLAILPAGSELSIFHKPGEAMGQFAAPVDTPFENRALPGNEADYEESRINIEQDQMVWEGQTAQAHGHIGGGTQYMTLGSKHPFQDYVDNGLATEQQNEKSKDIKRT